MVYFCDSIDVLDNPFELKFDDNIGTFTGNCFQKCVYYKNYNFFKVK